MSAIGTEAVTAEAEGAVLAALPAGVTGTGVVDQVRLCVAAYCTPKAQLVWHLCLSSRP